MRLKKSNLAPEKTLKEWNEEEKCQNSKDAKLSKNSGDIPHSYTTSTETCDLNLSKEVGKYHFTYIYSRQITGAKVEEIAIPSFIALYSKLLSTNPPPRQTKISLIPILPYPATTVNAIYTQMRYF